MTAPTIGEIRREHERAQSGLTAPTEAPSLTTEQARGLASRWAWWEAKKAEQPESWMYISAGPAPLLDTDERQLFAWVRAWMAERKRAGNLDACIGEALGLDDIDAAHALAHEATKAGPS